jgi:hypothetical protein
LTHRERNEGGRFYTLPPSLKYGNPSSFGVSFSVFTDPEFIDFFESVYKTKMRFYLTIGDPFLGIPYNAVKKDRNRDVYYSSWSNEGYLTTREKSIEVMEDGSLQVDSGYGYGYRQRERHKDGVLYTRKIIVPALKRDSGCRYNDFPTECVLKAEVTNKRYHKKAKYKNGIFYIRKEYREYMEKKGSRF